MTVEHYSELVNAQYGRHNLSTSILAALRAIGKDPGNVTLRDLAPLDHYHGGGYPATLELARRANLQPGQRVLDVGGGLGGPARTLAAEFGCTVTVLDLTEEFCRTGELLTTWTNLSHQVTFQQGNALALPFPDHSFDVVWAEYSFMNIAEGGALCRHLPGAPHWGALCVPGGHGWPGPTAPLSGALGRQPGYKFFASTCRGADALAAAGLR